jgi:hypothetical protein
VISLLKQMHVCFRSHPTRLSKICATRPTILAEDETKAGLESRSEHCYQAGGHYINGRPPQVTASTTPGTAPLCPRKFGILKELLQGLLSGLQLGFKPPEPRLAAASTLTRWYSHRA